MWCCIVLHCVVLCCLLAYFGSIGIVIVISICIDICIGISFGMIFCAFVF